MSRLPAPGSDLSTWATVLNDFLLVSHNADGTLRAGVFNAKDPVYGATGLGVADDATAINAAITACAAAGGGTVLLPPGTYKIGSAVVVPNTVNLLGSGGSKVGPATVIKCSAAGARVSFGALNTPSEGGVSGHFKIDGNNIATNPLFIGLVVDRKFVDICVTSAAAGSTGVLLQQGQNNTFVNLTIEDCAADGLTLDRGCGGNVFHRTEVLGSGRYNILFTQSVLSSIDTALTLFGQPELNMFYGGDLESQVGTQAANVLHEAGLFNTFHKVALASNTTAAHSMVKMTLGGTGTPGSAFFRLVDCYLLGNTTYVTGVDVGTGCSMYLEDTYIAAVLNGVAQATGSAVYGQMNDQLMSATNQFTGVFAANKIQGRTIGNFRALDGLGTNHYGAVTPVGGTNGDLKVGYGRFWICDTTWKPIFVDAVVPLTYSATIATDALGGSVYTIAATNTTAFTISTPTNPLAGQRITYDIKNSSGGAHGVITWGSGFLNGGAGTVGTGAFTGIANGKRRTISFYYDGTNWIETGRTGDI